MATLSLRHVQKIYPQSGQGKPGLRERLGRKKRGEKAQKAEPSRLRVTAEGLVVVNDFNLEVADNEFVVFVGPSGCGKSTTLRMIAGLEDITHGEIYIGERLVNDVEPKDRDIAMVFQNYALYPQMTVRQNLEFPLEIRKVPKEDMERRVTWAADVLGITDYLDRKPKALSGGQRQRVAIGRAIVRDPQVLLMDEPLSNLDAKLRTQMRAEILKLRRNLNATFIYVTHDQTEAMTLGDRIVVMRDGDIQQVGTPQQLFDEPENLFVAQFIGTPQMNRLDGELLVRDGRYAVRIGEAVFELSEDRQRAMRGGGVGPQKVIVGLRPEHIEVAGEDAPALTGTLDVFEMMGSSVCLHVRVGEGECVIVAPRMGLDPALLRHGAKVRFTFAPDVMHVFDPTTERNMARVEAKA